MLARAFLTSAFAVSLLVVACARPAEPSAASEGALLPNGGVSELERDAAAHRRIAAYFAERGLPTEVKPATFDPAWPLKDTKTVVLNRLGTPILFSDFGYYNLGFDVLRSDPNATDEVLATTDGLAVVFDWAGERITSVENPYGTIVAIYDNASRVITGLLHVDPEAALLVTDPVPVTRGQVIGHLGRAPIAGADGNRLSHVQVSFLDAGGKQLLDPTVLFRGYQDVVPPSALGAYVADANGKAGSEFRPGKLDVIVRAFDRDNDSGRNLEIAALAYAVKDQEGHVLGTQPRCGLSPLWSSLDGASTQRAKDLVDFGSASSQKSGAWPSSDVDNPERTFRYALTQLSAENGTCTVREDADAFIDVGASVTQLHVEVTLWDGRGNEVTQAFVIERAPAVAPDAGADAATTN